MSNFLKLTIFIEIWVNGEKISGKTKMTTKWAQHRRMTDRMEKNINNLKFLENEPHIGRRRWFSIFKLFFLNFIWIFYKISPKSAEGRWKETLNYYNILENEPQIGRGPIKGDFVSVFVLNEPWIGWMPIEGYFIFFYKNTFKNQLRISW